MSVRGQKLTGPDALHYRKGTKRNKQEQLSLLPVNHGKELCLLAAELLWDGTPGTGEGKELTVCAALRKAYWRVALPDRSLMYELENRIANVLGSMGPFSPRRTVIDWLAHKGYKEVYTVPVTQRQAYRKRWLLDMANTYDKGGKP